jgi:hypothetical protein
LLNLTTINDIVLQMKDIAGLSTRLQNPHHIDAAPGRKNDAAPAPPPIVCLMLYKIEQIGK